MLQRAKNKSPLLIFKYAARGTLNNLTTASNYINVRYSCSDLKKDKKNIPTN